MSYTKRLRKKALRAGATPGKALEAHIQQTLALLYAQWKAGDISALWCERQALKHEIERAAYETFVCNKLLTIGFTHTLPCEDYPQAMAAQLLPAKRRRVSTTIRGISGVLSYPRSYVYERNKRSRQYSDDAAKWVRAIISRFSIMSPSRLYVQVDMPGGMRKKVLRAPRGWYWKLRMLCTINPYAHTLDTYKQRYSWQVVLQSNSADMRHAVVTAGMIVTDEGDVVQQLRSLAVLDYDVYTQERSAARIREAAVRARIREATRLRHTTVSVSVRVLVAGIPRVVCCNRSRGRFVAYVYPG